MSVILNNHSGMAGYFMIEKCQIAPDGSEVEGSREVVAPWQRNLITDSGLDNLSGIHWMYRCRVGASNATPLPTDTQLGAELGTVMAVGNVIVQGPQTEDYASVVGTYVFPAGTATGNIAEIGVAPNTGNLTTRSLIRDEEGNPTVITKGPIDQLTVTYQIREYPDKTDSSYQVTNPHTGQVYDVVSRGIGGMGGRTLSWHERGPVASGSGSWWNMVASNSPLVPFNSTTFVSGTVNSSSSRPDYILGSHYRELRPVWAEGSANISGGITRIGTPTHIAGFWIQASFDPPIDKDNTKTLTVTMRKTWGRYTP